MAAPAGEEQLRFLEEIESLLRPESTELLNDEPRAKEVPQVRQTLPPSTRELSTSPAPTASYIPSPPHLGSPRPPSIPPPTEGWLQQRRGRAALRRQSRAERRPTKLGTSRSLSANRRVFTPADAGGQQRAGAVDQPLPIPPIDPREFLNPAELLLVSERSAARPASRRCASLTDSSHQAPYRGTEREGRGPPSRCWLRESEEDEVREWLRRKDREFLLKKRAEKRARKREIKEKDKERERQEERDRQAKDAYQQWLQRKKREGRWRRRRREEDRREAEQRERTQVQKQRPARASNLPSAPLPHKRRRVQRRSSTPQQTQQQLETAQTKKRITFQDWVKQKEKAAVQAQKKEEEEEGGGDTVPEDVQRIVRGVRRLRLQQASARKHVDSGIAQSVFKQQNTLSAFHNSL